jgi:hypothetical protein
MIVFQLTPCRLYPKIISLIDEQVRNSQLVHEVFYFKNKPQDKNPLSITKNDYVFPRCHFIYGIFEEKKIKRHEDDFWLTIKIPENKVLQEFFCAIQHYGSEEFFDSNKTDEYDSYLHKLLKPLYSFSLKDVESFYNKGLIDDIINDDIYSLRTNMIPETKFDYVGDFDNWEKTIKEIKQKIGLDLSVLRNENPYSYKIKP